MGFFHHLFLPHQSNNQRAKILHPSSISFFIGFFLLFQALLSHMSLRFPHILGYASQIPPEEVVRLTNLERQSKGLPALVFNPQLSQAAAQKAADMVAKDYWAHVSPSGTQPWFFVTESGYAYRYAGENLARDFSDSRSVVNAWMASPTHRENLLSPRYRDIGVAVVDGRLTGHDTTLVVQMFGTQLSAAPAVTTNAFSVKASEDTQPAVSPVTSPFRVNKYLSLGLMTFFVAVLVADIIIVNRRKLVRWTSKSLAHLIFVAALLAAATAVLRGQIL